MKNTDWSKTPLSDLYEHFDRLSPRDGIDFLIDVFKDFPNLSIDWLSLFHNFRSFVSTSRRDSKAIILA